MSKTYGLADLPAHVSTVMAGLLDFNHFLGLEATMLALGDEKSGEDDEDAIPLSAYKTDGLKASQRAHEIEFLENAQWLAEGAQRLENRVAQDSEWRRLFRTVVTSRKDDVHYSVSHSSIACAENEVWDTNLDPSRSSDTIPKPDLYFGFPVRTEEDQKIAGFRNDPTLRNYTTDILSQLALKGLRCIPVSGSLTNVAEARRYNTEVQPPLVCFPWCIIQLKGVDKAAVMEENRDPVLETSCQASVAASGALTMLERLARFADVKADGQHIPPVITITSVGPNTTVWLAFSDIIDDQYREHKMLDIWDGCISKTWDAIQFCRIIDNLFFWSQHILRPKVSQYIDQWRLRYRPEVHDLQYRLEKDLETAGLVHRIQDRLSSLNVSPNSNLPELVQQAVILQEVMKSNLPKTQPARDEGPGPTPRNKIRTSEKVPSHPKVDASTVGVLGDGVEREHEDCESKGDQVGKANGDNGKYCSTGSQDKPTLQLKSSENNPSVLADLPVSRNKSLSGESTAAENKQVALSNQPPTSKRVSESKSPPDSSADERWGSEPFSYPYEFQTSDFEPEQGRFLSQSHKSESTELHFKGLQPRVMASRIARRCVLPLRTNRACKPTLRDSGEILFDSPSYERPLAVSKEPTSSKDLGSGKSLNDGSGSASPFSAPPNLFTATSFELSFDVEPWWGITLVEASPTRTERPAGPHSAIHPWSISIVGVEEGGLDVRSEPPKRRSLEQQPAEFPRPPSLKVKIPWKGDRFITVKLPPVPAPASRKRPDPFPPGRS